jgi:hypothetical protein
VKQLMGKGERYILNDLYINDYLCWLQSLPDASARKVFFLLFFLAPFFLQYMLTDLYTNDCLCWLQLLPDAFASKVPNIGL